MTAPVYPKQPGPVVMEIHVRFLLHSSHWHQRFRPPCFIVRAMINIFVSMIYTLLQRFTQVYVDAPKEPLWMRLGRSQNTFITHAIDRRTPCQSGHHLVLVYDCCKFVCVRIISERADVSIDLVDLRSVLRRKGSHSENRYCRAAGPLSALLSRMIS